MNRKYLFFFILIFYSQIVVSADTVSNNEVANDLTTEPNNWGFAFTLRSASVPYQTAPYLPQDDRVNDVVPLIYYENNRFFWRGLEAGYKFITNDQWEFSIHGRYRFFDLPSELQNAQNQNQPRGNGVDIGFQYRYKVSKSLNADVELMDDRNGRRYVNNSVNFHFDSGNWDLFPFATLRWKSSEFNNRYYGLEGLARLENSSSPGTAFDLSVGGTVRYHVTSNLYLLGRVTLTMLDKETYQSSTISSPTEDEIYLGFAFFKDKIRKKQKKLKSKQYLRLAHGWATSTNMGEILSGGTVSDEFNNQLTSLFYGIPVSDTFFGINMPIYFTPGIVAHHKSDVQPRFAEYVVAIKFFYTIKWPTKWRVGVAEGLSYSSEITYIENKEMEEKGFRPSNLMNYVDLSLDIELGDLFNSKSMKNWWLGYSMHHRSAIFASSSAFGRIKGGSNYNSVTLQYHF